jgi:hypothetical protein
MIYTLSKNYDKEMLITKTNTIEHIKERKKIQKHSKREEGVKIGYKAIFVNNS